MGATNQKFAKSVGKPKKTKNIAQFLKGDKKKKNISQVRITEENWEHTTFKRRNSRWYPKHEVWGSFYKEEIAVEEKRKRVWVIST